MGHGRTAYYNDGHTGPVCSFDMVDYISENLGKPIWGNRHSNQIVWQLPQTKIIQGMHRWWILRIPETKLGVQQGSCSGETFSPATVPSSTRMVPESISVNGFADDHSLQKTFKARDKQQETTTKQLLEHTSNGIKSWMDIMPNLN